MDILVRSLLDYDMDGLSDISYVKSDIYYLDDGLVRREGANGGRDVRAHAFLWVEDRGDQADARFDVGVHDRRACVRRDGRKGRGSGMRSRSTRAGSPRVDRA